MLHFTVSSPGPSLSFHSDLAIEVDSAKVIVTSHRGEIHRSRHAGVYTFGQYEVPYRQRIMDVYLLALEAAHAARCQGKITRLEYLAIRTWAGRDSRRKVFAPKPIFVY